ncbi:MAG: ribonuclease R [Giesbergeria sp.]|nr:ribonuclease R [Giesbergeria sp.]MBP6158822.1 ribonuclease R [Giesbergeria sp.]MBP7082343.1 ribonuclease R [Giesbergeria sp.]
MSEKLPANQPSDEFEGTVQGHRDGHGFVLRDDGLSDIFLPPNEMRAVLHKDRVRVCIVRQDRRGRPEGRVVEIIERPKQPLIGRLLQESGVWIVAPEDKRYGQDVLIPKGALGDAEPGQVVVVELTEPPALYGQPVGRITEVLGEVDDPGMEIEIAVRKYGVPHEFSETCLAQAAALPDKVRPLDKKDRIDLTDVPLVTIDGEDARDFDDAVYCEPAKVGRAKGWRLLVAIADVSHYVQTGSAIDIDAYDRATSVYFPRRVIPMLPEKLSNGLCSLNPDVERLCMVCDMLITAKGEVHAYQFYPAVMFSHARFTYTEVAAILANTRGPEAAKRTERVPDLLNLHDVYRALLIARRERGAVDFETTETQIVCDDNGRIEKIIPRTRNDAHKLIEEAMLAANVCSADFIAQGKQHGLYRVHEGPTPEKQDILRSYLKAMAVGMSISDNPAPSEFQAIAEATKDRPDAQQIHTMLLRSMQQAIYTPNNSGHFGLAFEAYTHFTSPIRRYPDLLVHRVIKSILGNTRYRLPALPLPGEAHAKLSKRLAARAQKPGTEPRKKETGAALAETQSWEAAGLHCSANERRADEASRDVEAWLKCKYMREHLGEEFGGVVSSVTSFGIFVTLDAMYVEGLVHITELGGDYFKFDEARQELRGERSGIRYAIGSRVRVQVSRVDLDGRRIDFRLVNEGEIAVPRGPGERSGGKKSAKASEKPARERRGSEEAAPAPSRRQHEAAASKDFGGSSGSSGSGGKSKQKASLLTKAPSGKAKGRGTRH